MTRIYTREDVQNKIEDLSSEIDDPSTDALRRLSLIQKRLYFKKILRNFN